MNTEKKIKGSYGLQELALHYFPRSTPASASIQLKRWMNVPQLMTQLTAANYHKGQRILTPRQVEIIVTHIGEP